MDNVLIAETVMKPLARRGKDWKSPRQALQELSGGLLLNVGVRVTRTMKDLLEDVSRGDAPS